MLELILQAILSIITIGFSPTVDGVALHDEIVDRSYPAAIASRPSIVDERQQYAHRGDHREHRGADLRDEHQSEPVGFESEIRAPSFKNFVVGFGIAIGACMATIGSFAIDCGKRRLRVGATTTIIGWCLLFGNLYYVLRLNPRSPTHSRSDHYLRIRPTRRAPRVLHFAGRRTRINSVTSFLRLARPRRRVRADRSYSGRQRLTPTVRLPASCHPSILKR